MLRTLMDHVRHLEDLIRLDRRIAEGDVPFRPGDRSAGDVPGGQSPRRGDRGRDRHRRRAGPRPAICRRGRGCARATIKRPASGRAAGRPRGIVGCVRCWCKWPGRPAVPRRPSCRRPIIAGRSEWARSGRWWPWVAKILVLIWLVEGSDHLPGTAGAGPGRPDRCRS